jgi:DNA-binding MarR family transcriptional regulator
VDSDHLPFIIENLKEDTGFLLLQVSNLWGNYHDKALKRNHGLSHMQYAILASVTWLVYKSGKQVTQSLLAQHTKVNPMTISQMLKVLEAKGYVFRTKHPSDIRANVVHLTQEGNVLMNSAFNTIWSIDESFFKALGKNSVRFNLYLNHLLDAND